MTRCAPAKAPATVGTGVGPSEAPKRRKRAPAQTAASYAPWPCVLLAIDPGETSGWAVLVNGALAESGSGGSRADRSWPVTLAQDLEFGQGLPIVVVAESWPLRWRPSGAPREAWGRWLAVLDEARIPHRRIVRVNVGRWSAKILGSCALTTEARRAKSIAVARARTGQPITSHDEAAAVCLGIYASHAAEVGRVLPKGRAKR